MAHGGSRILHRRGPKGTLKRLWMFEPPHLSELALPFMDWGQIYFTRPLTHFFFLALERLSARALQLEHLRSQAAAASLVHGHGIAFAERAYGRLRVLKGTKGEV